MPMRLRRHRRESASDIEAEAIEWLQEFAERDEDEPDVLYAEIEDEDGRTRPIKCVKIDGDLLAQLVARGVVRGEPSAMKFYAALGDDPQRERQLAESA